MGVSSKKQTSSGMSYKEKKKEKQERSKSKSSKESQKSPRVHSQTVDSSDSESEFIRHKLKSQSFTHESDSASNSGSDSESEVQKKSKKKNKNKKFNMTESDSAHSSDSEETEVPVPVSSVYKSNKNQKNKSKSSKSEPSPSFNERQTHSEILHQKKSQIKKSESFHEKSKSKDPAPLKLQKLKDMKKNKKAHSHRKQHTPKGIFSDESESDSDSENKNDSDSSDEEPITQRNNAEKEKSTSFLVGMTKSISDAMSETSYERSAKRIILKVLKERKDKLEQCSIAFKGGKESSVILHLIRTVAEENSINIDGVQVIYFPPEKNEIQAVKEYVTKTIKSYNMHKRLRSIPTNDLSDGLQQYLMSSNIHCLFVGIKSGDIGAQQMETIMNTQDGTQLTRVHPLLTWTYKDIWDYIKKHNLEVCSLYEQGYTSIDSSLCTIKNPVLIDNSTKQFQHANTLTDFTREKWSSVQNIKGKVIKGAQRGRHVLNYPTARIQYEPKDLDDGIYFAKAKVNEIDRKYRKALVSVSSRFDLNGRVQRSLVVYIVHNYESDFYDHEVEIGIIGFLRKQNRFENEFQLRKAMETDLLEIKKYMLDKTILP